MEYTTLTHPQFARALRLAHRHHHGWADQLEALCLQTAGTVRDRYDVSYDPDRRARREDLLALATPEQLAALERVEAAILPPAAAVAAPRPEVAVRDLAHVAWIGVGPDGDPGIVAPALDFEGDVFHTTGSGRLEWLIDRVGGVSFSVNRPGPTLHRLTFEVVGRLTGEQAQALVGDPEYLAEPCPREEAVARAELIAESLRDGGHAVYLHPASGGAAPPEGTPVMIWLEVHEVGRGSITVLTATVGPSSHPAGVGGQLVVSREEPATATHLRHISTLSDALAALEVWWDPAVELRVSLTHS